MSERDLENSRSILGRRRLLVISSLALVGASCQRREPLILTEGPEESFYRVREGDTLYHIAKACNLDVKDLMSVNHLQLTELEVGQMLILPGIEHIPQVLKESKPKLVKDLEVLPIDEPWDLPQFQDLGLPQIGGGVEMISRQQWGAAPSKLNSSPMGRVRRITLHHTSEYPGMDKMSDLQVIRAIANFHRNSLGWADIGYHYLIGRDGKVYEGRPSSLQGAHTGGNNENNLGISMVGNFMHRRPSSVQMFALKRLLDMKMKEYGLSTRNLLGHRDLKATACPGDALYQWLLAYKKSRY